MGGPPAGDRDLALSDELVREITAGAQSDDEKLQAFITRLLRFALFLPFSRHQGVAAVAISPTIPRSAAGSGQLTRSGRRCHRRAHGIRRLGS